MNKKELEKLNDCKEWFNILRRRVNEINQLSPDEFENLSECTKRQFDQDCGEMLGLEYVLSRMGINVDTMNNL